MLRKFAAAVGCSVKSLFLGAKSQMAAFDPVPVSSLTKRTTLREVESTFPAPVERDWAEFKERVLPTDELWEYDTLAVHLGFACGESGIAIVRAGQVIERYPITAYG
jgi:hypothetical protein